MPTARVAALDAADQQDDQESRETFRRRPNADDATLIVEIALRVLSAGSYNRYPEASAAGKKTSGK